MALLNHMKETGLTDMMRISDVMANLFEEPDRYLLRRWRAAFGTETDV